MELELGGPHVFLSTGHFPGPVGIILSGEGPGDGGAGRGGVGHSQGVVVGKEAQGPK